MLTSICTNVFAGSVLNVMTANDPSVTNTVTMIGKMGNTILTIITNVAMVLAVVILAFLGVKYMMGSPEEKSEYKKSLFPYAVGAIIVFAASAIGRAVVQFAQNIGNV